MQKSYPIVGSFNNQHISNIDSERSVNLFEYKDSHGKKPNTLISTAGLTNSTIPFGVTDIGFRASFQFGTNMYHVVGNQIFLVNSANTVIFLGTINTNSGYVGIDANVNQVIFVDGLNGWIWDTSINGTLLQITDPGFPTNPIDVCMLDGFFVVIEGATQSFFLSMLNNGLIWSDGTQVFTANSATNLITVVNSANFQTGTPIEVSNSGGALPAPLLANTTYYVINVSIATIKLATTLANAVANNPIILLNNGSGTNTLTNNGQIQEGQISTHPGTIVACKTLHRRLFLFSRNFTEVWENQGIGTNLPIRRNNSLLMEVGTPSVGSVTTGFDLMFFQSQDKKGLGPIMQVAGAQPEPISTQALDQALAKNAANPAQGVSDARGIVVRENGLLFYRYNLTRANHTYVYNVSQSTSDERMWHEEEVLNGDRHPAQTQVYFNGINYYGDYKTNILYVSDPATVTNNGEHIRRMRIGRPVGDDAYHRLKLHRFHLDLVQGSIEQVTRTVVDVALTTEDSLILQTEDGQDILIEQGMVVADGTERPSVFLSVSKDGGATYGYMLQAPMGNLGQRTFRTVWRKLGTIPRGQYFVPKVEFFSAVPLIILGAAWDIEVMPE